MLTKTCTKCKLSKGICDFPKSAREKDGLQDWCKQCFSEVNLKYRLANPEKNKARHRRYQQENRAKGAERMRRWRAQNREKVRAQARKRYEANKESERERHRKYHQANSDKVRANKKRWRIGNAEYRKGYDNKYWRENKSRVYAKNARRRAAKLKATPTWADKNKIALIYSACVNLSEETGIEHHVDHIVPLVSKIVCGLHCESNLQILTGSENSQKHNSWWPDMP